MYPGLPLLLAVSLLETSVPSNRLPDANTQTTYDIDGVVVDIAGVPIPEAEVSVVRPAGINKGARTSKNGHFTIRALPGGQISIKVRRLGYEARTLEIDVENAAGRSVSVMLKPVAEELEAMMVTESEKSSLQEFYSHKANNNFAKFFERSEIEKRHLVFLSELLRSVAGAKLYTSNRTGNSILLRECKPMVWVDGMRSPGAELDEVARPGDVAALEVFPSSAGLPPQYQDRNNRMCGAIMVWTRNQ